MSREVQVRFCESVKVKALCATRPRSLRDVCAIVNEAQIPARRDGRWRATRIRIVLRRSGKHTVGGRAKFGLSSDRNRKTESG
jgi:hypothetical protein